MARVERRSRGWRLALSAPGPSAAAVAIGLMLAGGARRPDAADPPCRFSGIDRVVAVGDVHGAYDRFVGILQTAGLVDARLRWTGGSAHLVQLGDVVDRGPDSARVLDLLQRLQKEAPRQGGAVHPLLGNHEVMRMLGDLRYVSAGEYNAFVTLKSEALRQKFVRSGEAGPGQSLETIPLGFVELRLAFGRGGVYGAWLRTLQAVVDIDGVLFLHGGISPIVADLPCEAINAAIRRELTSDLDRTRAAPLASLSGREDGPLWYRGLALEGDGFEPMLDGILARQRVHAIVIGHTVTPDGRIRPRFGGKVVQIDTGMQPAYVPGGRASALEITRGAATAIYLDRSEALVTPFQGAPAAEAAGR